LHAAVEPKKPFNEFPYCFVSVVAPVTGLA